MKRVFFSILVFVILISGNVLVAEAENTTQLIAGKTYELSFLGNETEHLSFTMPSKGYFYFEVMPISYTDTEQNKTVIDGFYIEHVRVNVNGKEYEDNYWTWAGIGMTSKRYSFKKGTQIEISLKDDTLFSDEDIINYTIRVVVKKPNNFEKENNNTKSKANGIKKGKVYNGLLMESDTDYYVFKATKTKTYKIQVAAMSNDGVVRSQVLKGSKVLSEKETDYGDGFVTLYSGKMKKGQKIYIKIYGENPLFFDGNLLYRLKIK